MHVVLGKNAYGKSKVRLGVVERVGARHAIRELSVDVALEGEFVAAHRDGDNRAVLPTDTMKNTVYALARQAPIGSPEAFALRLGGHFLAGVPHVTAATVSVRESPWNRLHLAGREHDHAFERGSAERRTTVARVRRDGATITSGLTGLGLLKTTDSAFEDFLKDAYTTLKPAADRIFATDVTATWPIEAAADHDGAFARVRHALVTTFAAHKSRSVQETLYAMGAAALGVAPELASIALELPNKHFLLADLAPFGLDNPNAVFVPTDEPHGLITATVQR